MPYIVKSTSRIKHSISINKLIALRKSSPLAENLDIEVVVIS
jgi:hypothetical protein